MKVSILITVVLAVALLLLEPHQSAAQGRRGSDIRGSIGVGRTRDTVRSQGCVTSENAANYRGFVDRAGLEFQRLLDQYSVLRTQYSRAKFCFVQVIRAYLLARELDPAMRNSPEEVAAMVARVRDEHRALRLLGYSEIEIAKAIHKVNMQTNELKD